jgi:hypothetical protein
MADFKTIENEIRKMEEYGSLQKEGINPLDILEEKRSSIEKYKDTMALRIAKNAILQKAKNLVDSIEMEGVVLSDCGVDRNGTKNSPYSFPILFADGTVKTASSWDSKIFTSIGKYKFRGTPNTQYKNIIVNLGIKEPNFDVSKIPTFLEKITMKPESDFSMKEKYDTVVITGIINWVNSIPIWVDGEKVDTEKPFDEKGRPVLNFVLETGVSEKGVKNHITVSLQKNKNGVIWINHDELNTVLKDVYTNSALSETDEIIEELTVLTKGISITAIGELVSLKDSVSQDGEKITYITLRTLTIQDLTKPQKQETPITVKEAMKLKPEEKVVARGVDIETKPQTTIEMKVDAVKQVARNLEKILGRMPTVEELQKQLQPEQVVFAEAVLKSIHKEVI